MSIRGNKTSRGKSRKNQGREKDRAEKSIYESVLEERELRRIRRKMI